MLLNATQWQELRQQPERYASLVQRCQQDLDKAPQPVAILELQPYYNSECVNNTGQAAAKQLAEDGWVSY